MIKEQFFPTNIYGHDTQLDNNFLANEIVNWSKQNKGVQKTNVNGWHSETNMHELPQFKPLVDELFKMTTEVFKEEWLDRQPRLGNMWANNDPRPGIQTVMPIRKPGQPPKHLWRECHIDPKPGRIIMFPAWLWHCVEPNQSNDIRISVSFNFIQDGFQ